MTPALERLTAHLIDYAGTFAPASLAPEAALAEWRAHRTGSEARLVRALCWPADALAHLTDVAGDVTVIGTRGDARSDARDDDWDAAREADAAALTAFARTLPESLGLAAYECPLPTDRPVGAALDSLSGFGGVQVYVETTDPEALGEIAERDWASAKFRTVGASAEDLAAFLHACVSLELPFKLTAGLHAPYTGAHGFGFLNALAATARAIADDLTPAEIAAILRAPGPIWAEIEPDEADDARGLFEAIGSCSVREIAEGLVRCS